MTFVPFDFKSSVGAAKALFVNCLIIDKSVIVGQRYLLTHIYIREMSLQPIFANIVKKYVIFMR